MKYLPIIGIEVHLELKTRSKMFCGCEANHFGVEPNTHTCPVCLGLPGALPVPNKKAVEWCLLIGMALGCQIPKESRFDRKNYFYPDLPKGYQISQYDAPFCQDGSLTIKVDGQEKKIGIDRVHLEEDTGKLIHRKIGNQKSTLIDFNRSGVPLVEVVTKPEIYSSEEAIAYLKKLRQIIRYLNVSDCDMEKGSMRCEVNISLTPQISKSKIQIPNYKVEIKNLNSFRFVKKAIEYEIRRQEKIIASGKKPIQETRGFNEKTGETFSQRVKETAHDYRYFPEPDIPSIKWSQEEIRKIKNSLPELPEEKTKRFQEEYHLSLRQIELLVKEKQLADYFEKIVRIGLEPKKAANLIINRPGLTTLSPKDFVAKIKKERADEIKDEDELIEIVKEVIKENPKPVSDYRSGKTPALQYLIGRAMEKTKGRASAQVVKKLLEKLT